MRIAELVRLALEEDIGHADLTTEACVDPDVAGTATITAKATLVVCGHAPAAEVFRQLGATYTPLVGEGTEVQRGTAIARVEGRLASLLTGERVALNFLMRLCGIATHTRWVVAGAGGLKVVDTRKTTPLHRALERGAVVVGGGHNHRFALYDGVLIKDNHIKAAGGITAAVHRARRKVHHLLRVQCEVTTLAELNEALDAGVDAVLLDNMDDATMAEAIRIVRADADSQAVQIEASGNMTAERLVRVRDLGLDLVSVGGLIHQARWADLSMNID